MNKKLKWPVVLPLSIPSINTSGFIFTEGKIILYKTLRSAIKATFGKDFNESAPFRNSGDKYTKEQFDEWGWYFNTIGDAINFFKKKGHFASSVQGFKGGKPDRKIEKKIHLWIDFKKTSITEIIGIIAHELGHLQSPHYKNMKYEENKAYQFELIAMSAFNAYIYIHPVAEHINMKKTSN